METRQKLLSLSRKNFIQPLHLKRSNKQLFVHNLRTPYWRGLRVLRTQYWRTQSIEKYWKSSFEEPRESIENPVLERSLYIGSTLHTTSEPGIRGGYKGSPLSPLRTLYWRSPPKQFLVTQHQNLVLEGCTKAAHCAPPQNSLLQGSTQAVSHNSPRTQYWRYVHNLRTQYWRGLPFYT